MKQPYTIEVDFEVWRELTTRRTSESVTYNDVLRIVLGLDKENKIPSPSGRASWKIKDVMFPHGTEFRAIYKGKEYYAVVEDGALVYNDVRYSSPSSAAGAISKSNVNGWTFWEVRKPGRTEWTAMKAYNPPN